MRRRLRPPPVAVALLALALVLPGLACGGDEDGASTADATSATSTPSAVATPEDATASTTPSTGSGAGGRGGGSGSGGGTSGGSTPVTTVPPSTAGTIAPGGVGDLARSLLRPGNGDRIVVEVRAQAGAEPRTGTLDHLRAVLGQVSGKAVVLDGIDPIPGGSQSWTAGSIVTAAEGAAAFAQGGAQVVLRLLFVHGAYEGDGSVLGVAVRGDVAAVFTDRVEEAAGLLTRPSVVEDAVTVHEIGHLLGLVDLVIDTGRDDPEHPGHSTNDGSVMYWAVESDLVGQVLGGGVPTELDAQDRADLARIRAG
jgi:hypothetical protein